MISPEPLAQIQNNFIEMFLICSSTTIDQNIQLCSFSVTRAKIEIYLNHIYLVTGQYIIYSCTRIQVKYPGPRALLLQNIFTEMAYC